MAVEHGISEVPFRLYTNPEQYRLEQERIFKGPTWSYLCLAGEIPNPGDWIATTVGEVSRRGRGADSRRDDQRFRQPLRPSRPASSALSAREAANEITCIYHGWSYDLSSHLTGVAFEKGVKRAGGMPPEFRKDEHHLQQLRVAELSGLGLPGRSTRGAPTSKPFWGQSWSAASSACWRAGAPASSAARSRYCRSNWKLYFENVKDTYHASILHTFLTTFHINRLSQPGGINIAENGGNHFSFAKLDYAAEDEDYKREQLRASNEHHLEDRSEQYDLDRRVRRPGLGADD